MYANVNLLTFLIIGICAAPVLGELSGLQSLLQYFGLNMYMNGTGAMSRGQCEYTFESYALMRERHTCVPDDEHILHLAEVPQTRKPPIMLKCLQPEPVQDPNATHVQPKLLVMKSAKDIVSLLKPIGNATKRHEPGSCVVIHFCTPFSVECAQVAKIVNLLPYVFPTLPIAYIDAFEFTRFNAEFGVVSLPTLMIFHQGRPLIKYDPQVKSSVRSFIMRHTNVRPGVDLKTFNFKPLISYGPLSSVPATKTDIYLFLAWGFILICLANYMRRTLYWKQLVEMVQRNWRESEETQMEMID